jgi:hypothetical protein
MLEGKEGEIKSACDDDRNCHYNRVPCDHFEECNAWGCILVYCRRRVAGKYTKKEAWVRRRDEG